MYINTYCIECNWTSPTWISRVQCISQRPHVAQEHSGLHVHSVQMLYWRVRLAGFFMDCCCVYHFFQENFFLEKIIPTICSTLFGMTIPTYSNWLVTGISPAAWKMFVNHPMVSPVPGPPRREWRRTTDPFDPGENVRLALHLLAARRAELTLW